MSRDRTPSTTTSAPAADESSTLSGLRKILAATFLFGAVGTASELFLLEHTESTWQIVPLILLGLATSAMIAALLTRRALVIRALQIVLLAAIVSAGFGLWWHLDANLAFEREMDPDLRGLSLFWRSMHGVAPPALAPGTMALLGIVGLAWTYRHPSLARALTTADNSADNSAVVGEKIGDPE